MNKIIKKTGLIIFIFSFILIISCDDDNNESSSEFEDSIAEFFTLADLNGDGVIAGIEIDVAIQTDFNEQDFDNDQMLTELDHDSEIFPEYLGEPVTDEDRGELIHDLNDDGFVTEEEYIQSLNEQVDQIDSDNNGEITVDEALEFEQEPS